YLRDPGVHASLGGDRSCVPARLLVRERRDAAGGRARTRRRHRRTTGGDVPVRTRVSARRPHAGRHGPFVVVALTLHRTGNRRSSPRNAPSRNATTKSRRHEERTKNAPTHI